MTVASWLRFVVENPEPRLPIGTRVTADKGVSGWIVGYRELQFRRRWAYRVASIPHNGKLRYVFPEEILSAERPTMKPQLQEVARVG